MNEGGDRAEVLGMELWEVTANPYLLHASWWARCSGRRYRCAFTSRGPDRQDNERYVDGR